MAITIANWRRNAPIEFKNILLLFTFLLLNSGEIVAQARIYEISQVVDSTYGIDLYDRYNPAMGNDSVRTFKGYAFRGNVVDKYRSGKDLHKGYYIDGQLVYYTNYYPDGQIERMFKPISDFNTTLVKYYPDGKLKSNVEYFRGMPVKWEDYFPDGKPEMKEEYLPKTDIYVVKKTYYPNGNCESEMVLTSKKKYLYYEKNYSEEGKLKEEGEKKYDENTAYYHKQGTWKVYDEKGNFLREEKYINGRLQEENTNHE